MSGDALERRLAEAMGVLSRWVQAAEGVRRYASEDMSSLAEYEEEAFKAAAALLAKYPAPRVLHLGESAVNGEAISLAPCVNGKPCSCGR